MIPTHLLVTGNVLLFTGTTSCFSNDSWSITNGYIKINLSIFLHLAKVTYILNITPFHEAQFSWKHLDVVQACVTGKCCDEFHEQSQLHNTISYIEISVCMLALARLSDVWLHENMYVVNSGIISLYMLICLILFIKCIYWHDIATSLDQN